MNNRFLIIYSIFKIILLLSWDLCAQPSSELPVRAFYLYSSKVEDHNDFIQFIDEEISQTNVNHIFLGINYNYKFKEYPQVADQEALSEKQVKEIVSICRKHSIKLIPVINLLGHQSWNDNIFGLLRAFPEFEEDPGEKINSEDFYCRSYCPLHPDVHKVVFSLLDEIIEAFETDALHVGMDEVKIIGEESCPRCKGKNPAGLYAGEVNKIYDFLKNKDVKMYMWGDRLIDKYDTGLDPFQSAANGTSAAIDSIPKDIIICDWHYNVAPPTAGYFMVKGFNVISCSSFNKEVADNQLQEMLRVRELGGYGLLKSRALGVMNTYWGNFIHFRNAYMGLDAPERATKGVESFKYLFLKQD